MPVRKSQQSQTTIPPSFAAGCLSHCAVICIGLRSSLPDSDVTETSVNRFKRRVLAADRLTKICYSLSIIILLVRVHHLSLL